MTPELPIHSLLRNRLTESYGNNRSRMARAFDATPTMIAKWIADDPAERTVPSPSSCQKIARALHLEADDVLAMAGHREGSGAQSALDPRLAAFLSEVEAGWQAMDERARDMAERTARALFHVEPIQRRPRVTEHNEDLGSSNPSNLAPNNSHKPAKVRESRSLAHMKNINGFQPAY